MLDDATTTTIWRAPRPGDPFVRDGDTLVYQGQLWFYTWNPVTHIVTRFGRFSDVTEHTRREVDYPPRSTLELTKSFHYRKHITPVPPPRYAPPNHPAAAHGVRARWQGQQHPRDRVVDPEYLSNSDLLLVHQRLSSDAAAPRDRSALLERVRYALSQLDMVLVEHPPRRIAGIAIRMMLWACTASMISDDAVMANRNPRYHPQDVIRLLVTGNPKRPGSASWRWFELLRDGMMVAELRAAAIAAGLGSRRVAREIVWNTEQGYVSVEKYTPPDS